MKKQILLLILLIASWSHAQRNPVSYASDATHEAKLNALNLIASKWLDVSYEYMLNEESSVGMGLLVALNNPENDAADNLDLEYRRTFSLTPYYRQFFSSSYAKGFFLEAFGMLNTGTHFDTEYDPIGEVNINIQEKYTNLGFGISVGGKFVTSRGFAAEIYGGIGRNLFDDQHAPEVITRAGISLGYRF